ncbi:glycogen starch adp-glucose glycosyltransferasefamily 5 protein [Lichtheimia corymbifera JMRC:FSU:9682]|uniref:Glycogen starch adp-glucose glycosyltransferasefamily 5 protein n=1 Tax=Lichtheimia corymbifera JMRC:FSU:9682 TaxID=1263082 RepID=A0A068S3E0_9FUNG|nr:glycogen starch adp-glucose glycosyltransferasefamily 5 protein [Lichtheimia corymbifera JMRC:FSU:9682]
MVVAPPEDLADGSSFTIGRSGYSTRRVVGSSTSSGSFSASQSRIASPHRSPLVQDEKPYSKHDRRRRWWHILFAAIAILCFVQLVGTFVVGTVICNKLGSIRIDIREYPALRYIPLDNASQLITNDIDGKRLSVYHVTKEFGAASMGGMGTVVTAMATALKRTGEVDISIVMPFYSFLDNEYDTEKVSDLVINVNQGGNQLPVEFTVWKMAHSLSSTLSENASSLKMVTSNSSTADTPSVQPTETFPVYLIGPGSIRPFDLAFRADNIVEIYSTPDGLPQEWKDQYFNKAVAEFITFQAKSTSSAVDVVHLHGATNAYTMKQLWDYNETPTRPAIMYTLHDYLDELQYTIRKKNVEKFLDAPDPRLMQYTRGGRMFMSSLGIDYADVVTYVSHQMAIDMVEGRDDFYLKELIMESILRKAQQGRFFGITNGVDYGALDPFTSDQLVDHGASYPQYAQELLYRQQDNQTMTWQLSPSPDDYVSNAKHHAKRYLVDQGILSERDLTRPVILYVGRFQYNKGFEMFDDAARLFTERDAKLLIIGQPNNYPLRWVEDLEQRYPSHVTVMSTEEEQHQWLVLCRAASDFVFVPSLTESFGLVAAEGLLFGAPVISTGAGGLKEFLVDRPSHARQPVRAVPDGNNGELMAESPKQQYNAYLFEPFDVPSLQAAIHDAINDYHRFTKSKAAREELLLRMIHDAFNLGWSRGNDKGPVHDYLKAYKVAFFSR